MFLLRFVFKYFECFFIIRWLNLLRFYLLDWLWHLLHLLNLLKIGRWWHRWGIMHSCIWYEWLRLGSRSRSTNSHLPIFHLFINSLLLIRQHLSLLSHLFLIEFSILLLILRNKWLLTQIIVLLLLSKLRWIVRWQRIWAFYFFFSNVLRLNLMIDRWLMIRACLLDRLFINRIHSFPFFFNLITCFILWCTIRLIGWLFLFRNFYRSFWSNLRFCRLCEEIRILSEVELAHFFKKLIVVSFLFFS